VGLRAPLVVAQGVRWLIKVWMGGLAAVCTCSLLRKNLIGLAARWRARTIGV
jgi:hypothetical protein